VNFGNQISFWWSVCPGLFFLEFLIEFRALVIIMDTSPLPNILFANIFSKSVTYASILLAVPFTKYFFNFKDLILSIFLL
jgi:hypothetical protein